MIDIALKEWACVCDLLVGGKVCLLLRKGGVHEHDGPGRFKLEHDRFALFPAWEHETLDWIKPELRPGRGPITQEPAEIEIKGYAEVAGIWEVPSREAFGQLDDLHPWLPPQIDMRFNYKPDRPLYAMLVRAFRFEQPLVIPNRSAFAGCKSWVPLSGQDVLEGIASRRAIDETQLALVRDRVDSVLRYSAEGSS
ncbi:MAG: DUF1802 family protein [Planctomycetota bacterium]